MTLREFLEADDLSFFELIDEGNNYPFMDEPSKLDFALKLAYGSRAMAFEGYSKAELAVLVNVNLKATFTDLVEAEAALEGLTAGVKTVRTKQHDGNDSGTTVGVEVDKVSSFESDELLRDTGKDIDTATSNSSSWLETDTLEEVDAYQYYNLLTRNGRNNIMKLVIKDVSELLTLKIF